MWPRLLVLLRLTSLLGEDVSTVHSVHSDADDKWLLIIEGDGDSGTRWDEQGREREGTQSLDNCGRCSKAIYSLTLRPNS